MERSIEIKRNVLFLTLVEINSINERGIYQDLLRHFAKQGHNVTIVTPVERRRRIDTNLVVEKNVGILQVKTLNIQKTNVIEKGIGTLAIEYQYLAAVKKYLTGKKFDLILYSTPPITFSKVISYVKQRDNAYSYLLLKDIFPQNAVDMGMIKQGSLLHKFFLRKEKELYKLSDSIGCMSQANVDFVLKHNPEVSSDTIEVNPNSIEPVYVEYTEQKKREVREKYSIPKEKKILVYGGNLGKPQGVDFLLDVIAHNRNEEAYFLVVGNGTEFQRIHRWFKENKPANAVLFKGLPKKDYDTLLASCDIGLIFLHKDFTIPNFPSRLLSYLEMRLPVMAVTDPNTDIGAVIEEAGCGRKALAGNLTEVEKMIDYMISEADLREMGNNARKLLSESYLVDQSYGLIVDKINRG